MMAVATFVAALFWVALFLLFAYYVGAWFAILGDAINDNND